MRDISISLHSDEAPKLGVAGWLQYALGWPARVFEARQTMAMLGELTERDWRDIEPGRRDLFGAASAPDEDPVERRARARAIRAWYGHGAKAA